MPQGQYDEYEDDDSKPGVNKRKQELIAARESGDVQRIQRAKENLRRLRSALTERKGK